MSTLEQLNNLRARNNQPPLKAWKESKAKLAEAVIALSKKLSPPDTTGYFSKDGKPVVVKQLPPSGELSMMAKRREQIERIAEKRMNGVDTTSLPPPASVSQPMREKLQVLKEKSTGDHVTLADIARKINMDPKIARARMRRATVPNNIVVGKHKFVRSAEQAIIAILRGKKS